MFKLKVKILKGEYWYGGSVDRANKMPLTRSSVFCQDMRRSLSSNQTNTLFLSTKGRIIFSDKGFKVNFLFGRINCVSDTADIKLKQAATATLRGAYLLATQIFMPPDGKTPNPLMFKSPQYCTWIQFETNQNQDGILKYAQSILDCGMPAGELIIDDGWQTAFGDWSFDTAKFSAPKAMIDSLHALGYKVIMWITPFVSTKAKEYEYLKTNNLLVRDHDGNIAMRDWWNGKDAVLDFTNPLTLQWFTALTDHLTNDLGIDGFKQDAGDAFYYKDDDITYAPTDSNGQMELWALSSRRYDFNELRACFKCGCMGISQRISDKAHRWDSGGLGALIPGVLFQGIQGYAFSCPDMIGGGQMGDFRGKDPSVYDHELFARYCQTSTLMPMMQYSLNIWDLGNATTKKICQDMTALHIEFSDYIMKLVTDAGRSGEPIVRYMEYNFPSCGYAKVTTQFMLGDDYLVAPVLVKGDRIKKVYVPNGQWTYKNKTYSNQVVELPCELDELIVLTKHKSII